MKRVCSFLLAAALTVTVASPAWAAGATDVATSPAAPVEAQNAAATDQRLAAVTEKVKRRLGLDTGAYTDFYGYLNDGWLSPTWSLNWSGEDGNLSIEADEDGNILHYSCYSYYDEENQQPLTFPKGDRAQAQAAAEAFLGKVLEAGVESVTLEQDALWGESLNRDSFHFRGALYLNGVPTQLWVYLTVRAADNVVTNFYHEDWRGSYWGELPGAKTAVTQTAAAALLKGTLSMRLEYVCNDDGATASLQYLPNWGDDYYVDGVSGKLVNLSALYEAGASYGQKSGAAAPEAMATDAGGLTEVEQQGVDKLAGALPKVELDALIRAIPQLGLAQYTQAGASYYLEQADADDSRVMASLVYGRDDGAGGVWRKYITVDARTGALEYLWSQTPWDTKAAVTTDEAKAKQLAETFLAQYYDSDKEYAHYEDGNVYHTIRYDGGEGVTSHQFNYARTVNGYFFPQDMYRVAISAYDGSVAEYSRAAVSGDIVFDDPAGVVSMDEALSAWFATAEVSLEYCAVPVKVDLSQPEFYPMANLGVEWVHELRLGWRLNLDGEVFGVDAKTGQPLRQPYTAQEAVAYDDLEGHWAKGNIERLARYQVGYSGGSFGPDVAMTQRDMVALLMSTRGWLYNPAELDEDETDWLYKNACSYGILKPDERNEHKQLTRAETVKLLLDAAGYGDMAAIPGIYRCSYSDEATIDAQYYGYAAIAQGLGIVSKDGAFAGSRTITRAEAATMLYNLLNR